MPTSEDIPQAAGPNASMPFGMATQTQRDIRSVQSAGGGGPKGQQPQHPMPQQGGQPPQQQAPAQPPPPPPGPGNARLDMNQVFPPMPEMNQQPPWREVLRTAESHPNAGPALKHLADLISEQHGPIK